jgi:hypothetical protein
VELTHFSGGVRAWGSSHLLKSIRQLGKDLTFKRRLFLPFKELPEPQGGMITPCPASWANELEEAQLERHLPL